MAEGDYEVGYKKPPVHTRFRKGVAPPRRRSKLPHELARLACRELDETVVVTVGGRRRRISKREAIIAKLVDRSTEADLGAIRLLFDIGAAAAAAADPPEAAPLAAADAAVVENLMVRLRQALAEE
jgi:hypothetical protein